MRFLILFCALFSACSKTPPLSQQVARISLATDPTSLDPRCARDLNSITLLHMLFEGLTRVSREGPVELALAEKVQVSEDGLTYTFSLRDSCWSNGEPLGADDFVKSWKTILDPKFPTDIAYHLYPIQNAKRAKLGKVSVDEIGVNAPDTKTLVVQLESPTPYFLELLTMTCFFPVSSKVVEQNENWASIPSIYVCNGPFLLREWNHSDSIFFVKNVRYWQAAQVALEQVNLVVADSSTGLRMFEQGALDWVGSPLSSIPIDAIAALGEKLSTAPFVATYFFRVNTDPDLRGKPNPLSDPKLRKALAFAINRKAITEHILQGRQQPATHLVPPEMGLFTPECFADEKRAKELVMEVRQERGEIDPLVLSYTNFESNHCLAQFVQKEWERVLGISVELEAVEPKIYFQRVSERQFQLCAGSWTADFEDPINFLEVFKYKGASTNNTGWESAEYIDLLDRSTLCRNSEERRKLLSRAERILLEDMPILPVFHFTSNYLKEEKLQGVYLSPLGQLELRWAYWEKNEK